MIKCIGCVCGVYWIYDQENKDSGKETKHFMYQILNQRYIYIDLLGTQLPLQFLPINSYVLPFIQIT